MLGGGLQGACVALELATHGVPVDLFEGGDRCLTRASAQNEGKVHLGYVYANDHTLSTARTMVRAEARGAGSSASAAAVVRSRNRATDHAGLRPAARCDIEG